MAHTYSDVDLKFRKHPWSHDVIIKYDEDSAKQALMTLFMTNTYEKRFDPRFGLGFSGMVFELLTPITKITLLKNIQNQVTYYEPRIQIVDLQVNVLPDSNAVSVDFYFYVVSNPNNVQTLTLAFQRIR